MDPLSLSNPHMSSFLRLPNTYPPYSYKCHFLLPSPFMLPTSHWPLLNTSTPPNKIHLFSSHQHSLLTLTPFTLFSLLYNSPPSSLSHNFSSLTLPSNTISSSISSEFPQKPITMIKTLNPCPNPAKTAEIMSRYRPIAPKPETSPNSMTEGSSSLSHKIKQSPYLRNLWPQLQARPTRTRKRGRAPLTLPPSSFKRQKTHILGFCPPCHVTSPAKNLSFQGFAPPPLPLPHPNHGLGVLNRSMEKNTLMNPSLVTLPLLPCSPGAPAPKLDSITATTTTKPCGGGVIDLNTKVSVPEERDLLQQLQKPVSNNVIQPHPVRPIGSSITVVCIGEDSTLPSQTPKRSLEVEAEVESESLPVVISDSNHRVRMANSAYKEMVGQPLCPWLESMVNGGAGNLQCKRISGEVALHLSDSNIPTSSNGFSCWVRIEWQSEQKKFCVNAFCDVMKLTCESRDYLFTWRFHTRTREACQSSCTA